MNAAVQNEWHGKPGRIRSGHVCGQSAPMNEDLPFQGLKTKVDPHALTASRRSASSARRANGGGVGSCPTGYSGWCARAQVRELVFVARFTLRHFNWGSVNGAGSRKIDAMKGCR